MKIDTHLRGVGDVYNVLGQVGPREAKNILRGTVHGMAGEIRDDARSRAPVDDGVLKKAIKAKRERPTRFTISSTVRVEGRAFYWRFIEYGTSKLSERPYFLPTVEAFRKRALESFMKQFVKKFEAALARRRKRVG